MLEARMGDNLLSCFYWGTFNKSVTFFTKLLVGVKSLILVVVVAYGGELRR